MHIAAEQLNASAGTKITHVPYRGIAPALNDIMGKHIDFLNGDITVLYPLIQQGTIRALAVAGNERAKLLPDVPTVGEAGFKNVTWRTGTARSFPPRPRPTWSRSSKPPSWTCSKHPRCGKDLRQRRLRPAGREGLPRADREGRHLLGRGNPAARDQVE